MSKTLRIERVGNLEKLELQDNECVVHAERIGYFDGPTYEVLVEKQLPPESVVNHWDPEKPLVSAAELESMRESDYF